MYYTGSMGKNSSFNMNEQLNNSGISQFISPSNFQQETGTNMQLSNHHIESNSPLLNPVFNTNQVIYNN